MTKRWDEPKSKEELRQELKNMLTNLVDAGPLAMPFVVSMFGLSKEQIDFLTENAYDLSEEQIDFLMNMKGMKND